MKTVLSLILAVAALRAAAQTLEPTMTFDDRLVTFTNLQGKVFPDAHLVRADSKSIIVKTDDFYGNVPFTNLSQSTQEQLGLTPDYMAETHAFQEGRAKAGAAALERTKAMLAADQEKMSDTNNLLKMRVTAFSGAPVPSAYGTIYPCIVTLNGSATRVYVARIPLTVVNGYINQVNGLKGAISQEETRIANWSSGLKQRQYQNERANVQAPDSAYGDPAYVNSVMAQKASLQAAKVDLDKEASSLTDAQSQLDRQHTELSELQKAEPVLTVVTSGLMQGGLHVEVVVPRSND